MALTYHFMEYEGAGQIPFNKAGIESENNLWYLPWQGKTLHKSWLL